MLPRGIVLETFKKRGHPHSIFVRLIINRIFQTNPEEIKLDSRYAIRWLEIINEWEFAFLLETNVFDGLRARFNEIEKDGHPEGSIRTVLHKGGGLREDTKEEGLSETSVEATIFGDIGGG